MNFLRPASIQIFTNLARSHRHLQNLRPIAAGLLSENLNQTPIANNRSITTTFVETKPKGMFQKLIGKFSGSRTKLNVAGVLLYENVADKINYYQFFKEFDMKDTFNSWFLVTELHCWMLLTRVMQEGSESGEDGRFLRNGIVDALWADTQARAKKLTEGNPSAGRKQISIISEQFQAALISYDEGIMSDDKILASALWRRFFEMKCDDYSKLEKLVKYVRATTFKLDNMTRDELLKPQIEWDPISDTPIHKRFP